MPPKQRGANLVGRSKLFRHAIEDVHVGIGHSVLGNYAAALPTPPEGTHETTSVLRMALEEALLSYASHDVKRFRAAAADLVHTRELTRHFRKRIAHKLLAALLEQGEGYHAFVHLTAAFAKDLQELFLPFFEVFMRAINAGVCDRAGKVVPNPERQQRIFLAQALWFRELHGVLADPAHQATTRHILGLYVGQMCTDTRAFVRRLSAELLAGFARRARHAMVVVVDAAAAIASTAAAPTTGETPNRDGDTSDGDGDDLHREATTAAAAAAAASTNKARSVAPLDGADDVWREMVADGLHHFALECLRGLRGSLNASFETNCAVLLSAFGLLRSPCALDNDEEEELSRVLRAVHESAAAPTVVMTTTTTTTTTPTEQEEEEEERRRELGALSLGQALSVLVGEVTRRAAVAPRSGVEQPQPQPPVARIAAVLERHFAPDSAHHLELLRAACAGGHGALLTSPAPAVRRAFERIVASTHTHVASLCSTAKEEGKGSSAACGAAAASLRKITTAILEWFAVRFYAGTDEEAKSVGQSSDDDDDAQLLMTKVDRAAAAGRGQRGQQSGASNAERALITSCVDALGGAKDRATLRMFLQDMFDKDRALRDQAACGGGVRMSGGAAAATAAATGLMASDAPLLIAAYQRALEGALAACARPATADAPDAAGHLAILLFLPLHYFEGEDAEEALRAILPAPVALRAGTAVARLARQFDWKCHPSLMATLLRTLNMLVSAPVLCSKDEVCAAAAPAITELAADLEAHLRAPEHSSAAAEHPRALALFVEAWALLLVVDQHCHRSGRRDDSAAAAARMELLLRRVGDAGAQPESGAAAVGLLHRTLLAIHALLQGVADAPPSITERGDDLARVLRAALVSPSQVLRVLALELLQRLRPSANPALFPALIAAETLDPLASTGNLDAKRQALTGIAFEAHNGRIVGEDAEITARAMLGLLHLRFSAVWSTAMQVLTALLRHDLDAAAASAGKQRGVLWRAAVCPELRRVFFTTDGAAKRNGNENDDDGDHVPDFDAPATTLPGSRRGSSGAEQGSEQGASAYRVFLSDTQLHQGGLLAARGADAGAGSIRGSHRSASASAQQPWSLADVAEQQCDVGRSTDSVTVVKTLVTGLVEVAAVFTAGSATGASTVSPVSDMEDIFLQLCAIERREHATVEYLRGLEDRLALSLQLLTATPHLKAARLAPQRLEQLVAAAFGFISNPASKLQLAAAELLRKLRVKPFDVHIEQLRHMCGPTKALMAFLQSFHADSIAENVRCDFVAASILMALPKIVSQSAKAGGGGGRSGDTSAPLRRRIMKFLTALPNPSDLSGVIEMLVSRLLSMPTPAGRNMHEDESSFDFQARIRATPHFKISKQEQLMKQLLTAVRLVAEISSSVGTMFAPWAWRCFQLALSGYAATVHSLHPHPEALNGGLVSSLCAAARRVCASQLVDVFEHFPSQIAVPLARLTSGGVRDASGTAPLLHSVLLVMEKNARTPMLQQAGQTAAAIPVPLQIVAAWVRRRPLRFLLCAHRDFVASVFVSIFGVSTTDDSASVTLRASPTTIYEALRCLTDIIMAADESVEGASSGDDDDDGAAAAAAGTTATTAAQLREGFVAPCIGRIFAQLHALIRASSQIAAGGRRKATSGGSRSGPSAAFNLRMWKEVIQTVALCSGHASSTSPTEISQLFEIIARFLRSPACAADPETAQVAASVLESLVHSLDVVDTHQHFRPLVSLFNAVTEPAARDTLVRVLAAAAPKLRTDDSCYAAQMAAVARVVRGMNAFDQGADAAPFTRYDFELRFHTMYALVSFFTGARSNAAAPGPSSAGAKVLQSKRGRKETAPTQRGSTRHERQYTGPDDVSLPTEGPSLSAEGLAILAANVMFFLRDREATIRSLAAQTLAALVQYGRTTADFRLPPQAAAAVVVSDSDDSGSDAEEEVAGGSVPDDVPPFVHAIVRPIILPSLRQGVVARDLGIRNEHLAGFAALARHFPEQFPSFAAIYHANAEQSFFFNIKDAQHRCRMNALAMLRKAADVMSVRDILRVFVPYLVASVKDFAQGKRDQQNTTEGKAKGFAQAAILTIATFAKVMPWEGYLRILRLLLASAQEYEGFRPMMLSGVVEVLNHFRFLDGAVPGEPPSGRIAAMIATLERDILAPLYAFIQGDRKAGAKGRLEQQQHQVGEASVVMAGGTGVNNVAKVAQQRTIVQLPVAVAIIRIVKKFPMGYDSHIELLVLEIIAKLRTKNDKHRDGARRVLCSMMRELGIGKLGFVVQKLRDQLIHGYQLHVLGYTVVVLLDHLQDQFVAEMVAQRTQMEKSIEGGSGGANSADGERKSPVAASPPTTLDHLVPPLLDIFLDDYLGEIGEQKEQNELRSTLVEVKRSRAAEGFVFLAKHTTAAMFLHTFTEKVKWVIAPPTTELIKNASNSSHVLGFNSKYLLGEKNAAADIKFINKVNLLCTRVARGLMQNVSLDLPFALHSTTALFRKNLDIRAAKIAEFEAKDGKRRIRGNVDQHTAARRLSLREQFEANFAVAQRPDRIDADFASHTVLATQHKQKLRKYVGRMSKEAAKAAKDFSAEEPATAVVLDTLDEFYLRFLLSIFKRVLGIGKNRKQRSAKVEDAAGDSEDDDTPLDSVRKRKRGDASARGGRKGRQDEDSDSGLDEGEEAEEGRDDQQGRSKKAGGADTDSDEERRSKDTTEEEELEEQEEEEEPVGGEELDEFEKLGAAISAGAVTSAVSSFTEQHQALLANVLPTLLEELEGEGSDNVVALAMDNIHALVSLRPALACVRELGPRLFALLVMYFERGGPIKRRAMRVVSAVIQHQQFALEEAAARQLIAISRAEIIERSEYLPMALAVTLAVISRRVLIEEVYDIIHPVTELMMHLSVSKAVRERCVAVISRFLTEYKMTMDKVRSHIDLYVRNLTYPEATGRIALLELLQVLIFRLPTVVLQQEGHVFFIPLVSVVCRDEASEVREKAALVLRALVINAGIECFKDVLAGWLERPEPRFRTTGLQVLAHLVDAVGTGREAFVRVAWCVEPVLRSATHIQQHHNKKKQGRDLKAKEKEEVEMRNWEQIFFALRCAEALMQVHLPSFVEVCMGALLPHILNRVLSHTHPWIRACGARVLQRYLCEFVEPRCGYLANGEVQVDGDDGGGLVAPRAQLLFVPGWAHNARVDDSSGTQQTRLALLSALRDASARVVGCIEALDVQETTRFQLNRAIDDPHRSAVLQAAVLLWGATAAVSTTWLATAVRSHHAGAAATTTTTTTTTTTATATLATLVGTGTAFTGAVWTQAAALAQHAVRNGTPQRHVVRSLTLIQLFGAMISTLPTTMPPWGEERDDDEQRVQGDARRGSGGSGSSSSNQVTDEAWRTAAAAVVQRAAAPLADVVVPLVALSTTYEDCMKLAAIARNAVEVLKTEVQAREPLFAHDIGISDELPAKRTKRLELVAADSPAPVPAALTVADVIVRLEEVAAQGRAQRAGARVRKMHHRTVAANRRAAAVEATHH